MPEMLEPSEEPQRRSLDVSEWPVVRKVALVLAIPLLLAAVLGGLRVASELSQASAATSAASQVTVLGPAVAYLSAAEDAAMVFRGTEDEKQREAALKEVNAAATRLESSWSQADLSDAQRQQVRALLDETQGLRDGSAYALVGTAFDQLSRLEAEVTLGIAAMTDAGTQTESQIGLVGQLNVGRLAVTQQQLLIIERPDIIPKNELYGYLGVESAAIGNLELLLPDDASVELLRQYNASNNGLLGIGTPDLKGEQPLELYDELTTDLLAEIEGALDAEATASNRTALLTAALTVLALLIAIGLALLVSRLLVRPIQRVRDGALAVAHDQLPETVSRIRAGQPAGKIVPIPVTTHEEMGQLARAVDDLHGTAVRLAQDEAELRTRVADMFVTLSRRNTSLVNQQLHLIERLERDEEDPERLESLFRLDHLASRMRRTAESLVVLADAPTQHSGQTALTVEEVLQAATAGVRDYQRVQLSGAPALRISGSAAPDVVHMFTELIDNALSFSPPTSPVTITTTTPAGLVLVEIADVGLGIETATMTELNTTLRTGAEVTAETARRMGLFVVARLARRHGLTVSLERNAEGGTTVKVFVPKPLLTSTSAPIQDVPEPAVNGVEASIAALTDGVFRRPVETPEVEPDRARRRGRRVRGRVRVGVRDRSSSRSWGRSSSRSATWMTRTTTRSRTSRSWPWSSRSPSSTRTTTRPRTSRTPRSPSSTRTRTRTSRSPWWPSSTRTTRTTTRSRTSRSPRSTPRTRTRSPRPRPRRLRRRSPTAVRRRASTPCRRSSTPTSGFPSGSRVRRRGPPRCRRPCRTADRSPCRAPTPVASEQQPEPEAREVEVIDSDPEPELEPSEALTPAVEVPQTLADETTEAVGDLLAPNGVTSPVAEPLTALDGAAPAYALNGHADDDETPLFRMLRSSWFTNAGDERVWDSGEADAGWQAAGRATDAAPSRLTQSGLPVRDPGNRLVPGGVAKPAPALRRDPEEIRSRLAAHAAGVARGRTIASKQNDHLDQPTETHEDVTQ